MMLVAVTNLAIKLESFPIGQSKLKLLCSDTVCLNFPELDSCLCSLLSIGDTIDSLGMFLNDILFLVISIGASINLVIALSLGLLLLVAALAAALDHHCQYDKESDKGSAAYANTYDSTGR